MKRRIVTQTGILLIMWSVFTYVLFSAGLFHVGYVDPSSSLIQAVARVGKIDEVSGTQQFKHLSLVANQMSKYVHKPYQALKEFRIHSTVTIAVAGVLILVFARWIPQTEDKRRSTPPNE